MIYFSSPLLPTCYMYCRSSTIDVVALNSVAIDAATIVATASQCVHPLEIIAAAAAQPTVGAPSGTLTL